MPSNGHHSPATPAGVPTHIALIDALGLFHGEMINDLVADYFSNPDRQDCWLTGNDKVPVGVAYYAPERLNDISWNLYPIAIQVNLQGQGRGSAMMRYIEHFLRTWGERMLSKRRAFLV